MSVRRVGRAAHRLAEVERRLAIGLDEAHREVRDVREAADGRDVGDRTVEKRVFAPNHFRPESQEAKEVVCVFAAAELLSGPVDVEVRPAAFFGKEGRGIRGRVS